MYCGSCLRDNALAAELKSRGHDVVLVPLYTPTLTDEPNVSEQRVFFGGISVYLQQHAGFFRWAPRIFDRLLDAPWLIKAASSGSISTDPRSLGEMTISMLKGEDGFQRKEFEKMLEWLASEPAPDVVQLPNALLASLAPPISASSEGAGPLHAAGRRPVSRRSHEAAPCRVARPDSESCGVCRSLHGGERILRRLHGELSCPFRARRSTSCRSASISTDSTGATMRQPAGHSPSGILRGSRRRKDCRVCATRTCDSGRCPESRAPGSKWRAISLPISRTYLEDAERRLTSAGLGAEFQYRGALDREQKIDFLRSLDVFSVPTVYVEPKGLFLLEAMACGSAGRAAAARSLPRDAREDVGRNPRRAGRCRQPRRRALRIVEESGTTRRAWPRTGLMACAVTTASAGRPIACSKCTRGPRRTGPTCVNVLNKGSANRIRRLKATCPCSRMCRCRSHPATPRRSWDRQGAGRALSCTFSARSSRRRPDL